MIDLFNNLSVNENQISSKIGDRTVILKMNDGIYYELNEVGSRVWELIQQPKAFHEILQIIMKEFDVDQGVCEQDLKHLFEDLQTKGLIRIDAEMFY